jgi:hypothetical protein
MVAPIAASLATPTLPVLQPLGLVEDAAPRPSMAGVLRAVLPTPAGTPSIPVSGLLPDALGANPLGTGSTLPPLNPQASTLGKVSSPNPLQGDSDVVFSTGFESLFGS